MCPFISPERNPPPRARYPAPAVWPSMRLLCRRLQEKEKAPAEGSSRSKRSCAKNVNYNENQSEEAQLRQV